MRSSTILIGALLLTGLTTARNIGIAVLRTIAPGSPFNITVEVEGYNQSVKDIAIEYGIQPVKTAQIGTLGAIYLGPQYLGRKYSNVLENITHTLIAPKTVPAGENTFTGVPMSLYGALYAPSIEGYAVNVRVGKATSKGLVSNTERSIAVL